MLNEQEKFLKKYGYKILISIPFLFLVFAYFTMIRPTLMVDSCLDLGGAWNYETKNCETE